MFATDFSGTAGSIDQSLVWLIGVAAVVLVAVTLITSAVLSQRLRPLGQMVGLLGEIADGAGDLTRRLDVDRRDEIGALARSFNTVMAKLHDIIAEVKLATAEVAAAARSVSGASDELASGSQSQAGSLEETFSGRCACAVSASKRPTAHTLFPESSVCTSVISSSFSVALCTER